MLAPIKLSCTCSYCTIYIVHDDCMHTMYVYILTYVPCLFMCIKMAKITTETAIIGSEYLIQVVHVHVVLLVLVVLLLSN